VGGGLSGGRSTSLNTPGAARPSILIAQLLRGLFGYGKRPDAALTLADLQPFLRRRYEADVRARLTRMQAEDLEKIVRKVETEPFSVKDAAGVWRKERSRVPPGANGQDSTDTLSSAI
jgi:hypothetical protein